MQKQRLAAAGLAADIYRVRAEFAKGNGRHQAARRDLARAHLLKRAVNLAKRPSTTPPVMRAPVAMSAPRERRERVSRSITRSGDSGDDPPPPSRRLDGRRDIELWLAERKRDLDALRQRELARRRRNARRARLLLEEAAR
jgi:hypothetical protein